MFVMGEVYDSASEGVKDELEAISDSFTFTK